MAIRGDSYSTVAEVTAFTRHLLDGSAAFDNSTRPTLTELEKFIDRASGALNAALAGKGLTVPVSNSTAKLVCDDWVTARAAEYVELTQRGSGYSDGEGNRVASFRNMHKAANDFATENALGFKRLGVGQTRRAADGLAFTGQTVQADRADPDDTTLEQPKFKRGLFDDEAQSNYTDGSEET